MPSKVQLYAQMADRTAEQITGSYQKWTAFLTTAARLYKYPYNEQLMIFAQRPEATACAEYDLWNKQMHRYVRQGSKGIALVDTSSDQPKLRYVFDVSDTSGGENSRRPYLWEYRQEHREVVSAALEQRFDVSGENGLADQLERVAAQLVDEYWHDNRRDIVGIVDGSFLEDYDEFNIGAAFRNAAVVSTTYALLSRCGMQPGDYFEHEDFLNVFDFNTPQTVAALGTAISQSSELVLRQIEVTIKNYEREKIAERSESHERTDLHPQRRISDPRPEPAREPAEPAARQIRTDAADVSPGASPDSLESDDSVGNAVPAPAGDRQNGEPEVGADDAGADEVGRSDGNAESSRPVEVDRADEHLQGTSRGNDPRGAGVQLNMFDAPAGAQMSFLPPEAEQIQSIAEAESVAQTPSAFSMFISQDDIDHILRTGGNEEDARMRIAAEFSKQKPLEERAAFLKALYHGGNGLITGNGKVSAWYGEDGIHIASGAASRYLRSAQVISWADAAERTEELLDSGTFATNLEVTEAPRNERLRVAAEVWELYHDFSDEAKSLGYMSCMGNIRSTNYPEERELLADNMANQAFRERLLSEYKVFMDAYRENRALLRFHYHRPQALLTRLEELSLPRKEYHSDMATVPKTGRFITEDEISASLANGSSVEGGKTRIYTFFQTPHTPKESADFLKKEYGIGGHTHAVSGENGSYEDHGSKGITLKKAGCADVQMNWNKVASRVSALIRLNRYFTPDEQALYDKALAQDAARNTAYNSYNAVKEAHPDDIVLYQVGDFFEMYGEDARQAELLLDLNLTSRNIPDVGRVTMCGIPAHSLEQYVEKLRDKYDVTIAATQENNNERRIYTLPSIDHEAENAINAYEAEFGADGTRVFRNPAAEQPPQPTVRELFDGYKLTVGNALSKDTAFVNACRNSDRQNAYLEGADAIRRIVTASDDLQLVRLYFDIPAFHNRLHQELLEELYPTLATTVAPSPYQITQEDIDNALLDWHDNLKGKQEVALYMQAHGRERSTAAWLAAKYGWEDSKTPMYIHVGNAEPVTLTWAQVQRRLAQLIRENKFYDENERLRLFSPDRYSIRLHPGEGGITGIWDEVLERFCGDGEQTLRFAEQNNAIAYLDGIKRDMGIELSPPAFTTPLGYTYHIGDRISSIELDHIAAVGAIARVDEDHVWHTLPNAPEQEPVSIDRNSFERYLDTRYFEASEPEPQRVLMGSTAKMGAGTNVQDRLVALHDLDCPWRPRDLTQRKGRIERQGNQNKLVHVCRYVTEGTFDAYLWQTVENKQKFISQIMTSKSPVRSCEDVDATALSFAEIKALCAGDPRIKERMDLDIEVSKLKIMKADHNSKQFRLEDSLLKYFPEKIEEHKGFVRGLEADMQTLAAHPLPVEGFVGMEIRGDRLTDKENAGAALLDTCKEVKGKDPVQIGSYRGFTMSVAFDSMWKTYTLTLKGQMTHRVELGSDARGNLVRIENALDKMPERLRSVQDQLENLYNQQAAAKAEVGKPFPQEQELAAKTARLIELDMELNLDGKGQPQPEQSIAKSARPSVLDRLKASPVHGASEKPHKKEMEAR